MSNTFQAVKHWADKYQLKYDEDCLADLLAQDISSDYEQNAFVCDLAMLLGENGFFYEVEQYDEPDQVLGSIVKGYLSLTNHEAELVSVSSSDDWESANIKIKTGGAEYVIGLPDVDGANFIKPSLPNGLMDFSRNALNKIFVVLWDDDSNYVLYLPSDAVSELERMKSALPEPAWGIQRMS